MHPAKYQCIQPINFNDPHTHTHRTYQFVFLFFEKEPAKYQFTQTC